MSETLFEYASLGAPDALRTVVLLREGALASTDPDVEETRRHDVRLVAVRIEAAEAVEPGAYGGETPASVAVAALRELVDEVAPDRRLGLVGVAGAGPLAVQLAADLPGRIDRLALVAVPVPEAPLDRDEAEGVLAQVAAETIVLDGEEDPDASAAAAEWHRAHLPSVCVELVPASAPDGRLALSDVWQRVLAHTAPGTTSG